MLLARYSSAPTHRLHIDTTGEPSVSAPSRDRRDWTSQKLICPDKEAARVLGAVLACSAVAAERVVPAAFLVAAVLAAIRALFRVVADCLEVAGRVSREDSLADSPVLAGYWASDSDAQAYSARPPGAAARSGYSRSDLVCLPMRVRAPHPAR